MKRKVLVAGATGFIGRQTLNFFADDDVTILSRNPRKARKMLGDKFSYTDYESVGGEWDVFLNLAGERFVGPLTPGKIKRIFESRGGLLRKLAEKLKVGVLVSASAVGYYGARADDRELSEDDESRDFSLPAKVCKDWEDAIRNFPARARIALRIGVVLGRGGILSRIVFPSISFPLVVFNVFGGGENWIPWVWVGDVARAFAFVSEWGQKREGFFVFNVVAGNVRGAEFVGEVGKVTGKPVLPFPIFLMRVVMGSKFVDEFVLSSLKVSGRRIEEEGFKYSVRSLRDALERLFGGGSF